MEKKWKFSRFGVLLLFLLYQNLILCWSLNDEGLALLKLKERVVSDPYGSLKNWKDDVGVVDPCSWFGVECSDGNVVVLLLDNNELLGGLSPGIDQLRTPSEHQVDENKIFGAEKGASSDKRFFLRNIAKTKNRTQKRLLQEVFTSSANKQPASDSSSGFQNPYKFLRSSHPPGPLAKPSKSRVPRPVNSYSSSSQNNSVNDTTSPSRSSLGPQTMLTTPAEKSSEKTHQVVIIVVSILGALSLLVSVITIYVCKSRKATVKPWTTGLSGQLQKAFVAGVQKLKRSDLDAACEDFSNVIGSSPIGTLYKGTLSSGVEIAVASVEVKSARDWSTSLELQFRKKIDTLSKMNHKNFVNLLGYCEEEEPFTRMMVFEYAPNGTLFEHLHFKESEHLDWGTRLRIAMGMAYCIEHMHQFSPPITHNNLNSSAVRLTEDYAAKISDLSFFNWMTATATQMELSRKKLSDDMSLTSTESNVYCFGVLLFEMITGRLPYSVDNGSLENWASDYLRGDQPLREIVDPTLASFEENKLESIGEVVKFCVHPIPDRRPAMSEVCAKLRDITKIAPDAAVPKLSPLWWAELEILPPDAS